MKPSGAGFVGHVHERSSSTFYMDRHLSTTRERVGAPAQNISGARQLRYRLPRVEPDVVHAFIRPLRHRAAKRRVAVFSRHGHDAVAMSIMKGFLISGALVLSLFHSVRPPPPATAEPHHAGWQIRENYKHLK